MLQGSVLDPLQFVAPIHPAPWGISFTDMETPGMVSINRIRQYIDDCTCAKTVQVLAVSKLDCANPLLVGMPTVSCISCLAQNSAAHQVSGLSLGTDRTPMLRQFHWLHVQLRMQHKLISIVFNRLNFSLSSGLLEGSDL